MEHEGIVATKGVISNSRLGCPSLQAEGNGPKWRYSSTLSSELWEIIAPVRICHMHFLPGLRQLALPNVPTIVLGCKNHTFKRYLLTISSLPSIVIAIENTVHSRANSPCFHTASSLEEVADEERACPCKLWEVLRRQEHAGSPM